MARVPTSSLLGEALTKVPRSKWTTSNQVAKAFLACPRLHYINRILCFRGGIDESRHEDVLQNAWLAIMSPDESGDPKILSLDENKDSIYSYMWMFIFYSVRSMRHKDRDDEDRHSLSGNCGEDMDGDPEAGEKYVSHFDIEYGTSPNIDDEIIGIVDRERATKNWLDKLASKGWPAHIPRDASHFIRLGRPRKIDQEPILSDETLDYESEAFDPMTCPPELLKQKQKMLNGPV